MIRFDETARTVTLSVSDLLSSPLVPVTREGFSGSLRNVAGLRVHGASRTQEAGSDLVRTEVPVSTTFSRRNLTVRLEGRLDLLRRVPGSDAVEVEEIKSLLLPGVDPLAWTLDPAHAEQVVFYACLLQGAGTPVRACRVIYVEATDGATRAFAVPFDADAAGRLLHERIDMVLDEEEESSRARGRRRKLAETLPFPHAGMREPQRVLVHDIATASAAGRTLMCSAPTGIGKTAAALYPVVKQALKTDGIAFFLTSRVSQQELALRTLTDMLPPNGGALAVQITAKERSCPFPDWQCVEGRCPLIDNFQPRLTACGIESRLAGLAVLSGESITRAALAEDLCPFETTLVLARKATAVVADYNYVFHPGVALKMLLEHPERPLHLIVDEAHNLPSRVADFYSPRLDVAEMDRLATIALAAESESLRETGKLLDAVCRHQRAGWKAVLEQNDGAAIFTSEIDRSFFVEAGENLDALLYACFLALAGRGSPFPRNPARRNEGRRGPDPLLETLYTLRSFCACAACDPALFAPLWNKESLRLLCLNPAVFIRQQSARFASSLFMSATLTPFSYYARMLGVEENTSAALELPSPFPRENRLIVSVPTIDTSFKGRGRDAEAIAALIVKTTALRPGNYLAFFPSFAFRDLVTDLIPRNTVQVILQKPAMPTEPVLKRLRENTSGTLLLCAVQGGVFAEGVDYPGHLAIGAFIVGPGLPMVCPELKILENYFETHDGKGKGFELAFVTPGVVRAVQAGGRVIRSETDRGFVMLIGKRFQSKLYREKLPLFWREEIVDTPDPAAAIAGFWSAPAAG
ncbi:MAG: ATP-dependent DNA helicase [Kiritimatiellia bacterium]